VKTVRTAEEAGTDSMSALRAAVAAAAELVATENESAMVTILCVLFRFQYSPGVHSQSDITRYLVEVAQASAPDDGELTEQDWLSYQPEEWEVLLACFANWHQRPYPGRTPPCLTQDRGLAKAPC